MMQYIFQHTQMPKQLAVLNASCFIFRRNPHKRKNDYSYFTVVILNIIKSIIQLFHVYFLIQSSNTHIRSKLRGTLKNDPTQLFQLTGGEAGARVGRWPLQEPTMSGRQPGAPVQSLLPWTQVSPLWQRIRGLVGQRDFSLVIQLALEQNTNFHTQVSEHVLQSSESRQTAGRNYFRKIEHNQDEHSKAMSSLRASGFQGH